MRRLSVRRETVRLLAEAETQAAAAARGTVGPSYQPWVCYETNSGCPGQTFLCGLSAASACLGCVKVP